MNKGLKFIYTKLIQTKSNLEYIIRINKPFLKKKIWVVNTPLHNNIGDSAITCAQIDFCKKYYGNRYKIVEITIDEMNNFYKLNKKFVRNKDRIMLLGGGNMGVEWFNEEEDRRKVITTFKDNKIISFPQTIYYGDGKEEFLNSIKIYNIHNKLNIMAREQVSFNIMNKNYNECNVKLLPDIVLTYDINETKRERRKVGLCFRSDKEGVLSDKDKKIIVDELEKYDEEFIFTDMISEMDINKENRRLIVNNKLEEFKEYKLVITDRLHGMIFAAITGTPCIAFGNYNYKVKGVYDKWLKDIPYIKYMIDTTNIKDTIKDLLNISNMKFNTEKYTRYFLDIYKQID